MPRLGLESFWTVPRVSSLLLSPDGRRLVLSVQALAPDGTRFVPSLWEMPADGSAPARRITYSDKGEGAHAFLPDGSLLFASARPDVTVKDDEADGRLFRLPAGGGEAEPLLSVPGGVEAIATARDAAVAIIRAPLYPDSPGLSEDAAKAKSRKEAGVSGVLFESLPIRHWDHDVGPRQARILRLDLGAGDHAPRDLAPDLGNGLHESALELAPDGSFAVATCWRNPGGQEVVTDLLVLDGSERRTLGTASGWQSPAVAPDGRRLAAAEEVFGTVQEPFDVRLCVFDLATGEGRALAHELDLQPAEVRWAPDGASVWLTADEEGRGSLYNVPVDGGPARKVAGAGPYTSFQVSPDGASVFALRTNLEAPATVVRIDTRTGEETALPTPGLPLELPGRLEEVSVEVEGARIRAWLVLPDGASATNPAPLLLWVHGGPYMSWNGWSWRWCPYLMAERGYAVLMPDPALSTGYGSEFIRRGWHQWGEPTWRDLEAILDEALRRPDLDETRTGAMGGSFGGYMANWIAGHTERFRGIVTHASPWDMAQFQGTSDGPYWFAHEFGDPDEFREHYERISPRTYLDRIRTPMLIVHGAMDYRVPVGESIRMYQDLRRRGVPAKFLYYPDENHWVLKPGNSRLWYETVLAFLDEHVLGAPWQQPELL